VTSTRRALLGGLAGVASATLARPAAARGEDDRLLLLRHQSVLLELAGRRVLIDPSLEPSFSAQGLVTAPRAALEPERVGPLDVVVITSGEPWSFDPRTMARLDIAHARVLVPDEDTARRARRFTRRVRVLAPHAVTAVAGLTVRASPGRGAFHQLVNTSVGRAMGVHLTVPGTKSLWHTGLVPPLDVDANAVVFARANAADVVLGCGWGASLRAGGPALIADIDDATALATLCGAHTIVPLGVNDAPAPAGLFQFVWRTRADHAPSSANALAPRQSAARGPTVHRAAPGQWYRFG